MTLSDEAIARRIGTGANYEAVRGKMHRLRRLTVGDITALEERDGGRGATSIEAELSKLYREESDLYDVIVTDIEAGRENDLVWCVRNMAHTVSMTHPALTIENLPNDHAAVNQEYFKAIAKRTGARLQVRRSVLDYLIGGLGAVYCGQDGDNQILEGCDILDVTWDLLASTFDQITWASRKVRWPMWRWLKFFEGDKKALATLKQQAARAEGNEDLPITVECYHDVTGIEDGNEAYFLSVGDSPGPENILHRGKNLYGEYSAGTRRTVVPIIFLHSLEFPSVKIPMSMVEFMLASQIGVWEADDELRTHIKVAGAYREAEAGTYTPESIDEWKNGERGAVLIRNPGKPPMTPGPGLPLDQNLYKFRQDKKQHLVTQSGVNPYQSGAAQNVDFASETQAIQAQSGLVAGAIGKDTAEFWQKVGARILANGKDFDENAYTFTMMEGDKPYRMTFDSSDPIGDYLAPDADIVVSEDQVMFQSSDERLKRALADVEFASKMANLFPGLPAWAAEQYLRARKVKDIAKLLTPAAPMPTAPGIDPAAAAMASTAA